MRNVYRVNYQQNSREVTTFVAAETGLVAVAFLGIGPDVTASVNEVAHNVEVVGLDTAHAQVAAPVIYKAPPAPPVEVSREEFAAHQHETEELRKQLILLHKQLSSIQATVTE